MRIRALFALLAAGTIALAACGSDNSSSSSSNAPAAAATTAAASATTAAASSATTAAASSATTAAATPTTAAATATTAAADNSGYGNAYAVPPTAAAASGAASITLADSSLGKIVVDANGMTLYAFLKDTGGTSTCSAACANAWPPATATGTPTSATEITAALTAVARPDGTMQLKLGDWPLYRFAGDSAKGDTNGQGSNSVWYVVGADGQPIK
jgi:predicted lipoprotein with Yx(FWY)xxD motif